MNFIYLSSIFLSVVPAGRPFLPGRTLGLEVTFHDSGTLGGWWRSLGDAPADAGKLGLRWSPATSHPFAPNRPRITNGQLDFFFPFA